MGSKLIVRSPVEGDFEQWLALWKQYNDFYGRAGDTALTDDINQSTWQRFFAPDEPVHCLVAEYDTKLVGFGHYIYHKNTITIEDTCYLQDLFSIVSMRGKGGGRALINEFCECAKQSGCTNVYWHTHSSNDTAMKLYNKIATNTDFVVYRKEL